MIFPLLVALIFPGLMSMAAAMDFLTMTIPNAIPALLSVAYLILAAIYLPPLEILSDVSCGLAILTITFAMFSMRWIGGGDAKLAAATALWMGWGSVVDYAIAASILGGILTLGLLTARLTPLPALVARAPVLGRLHELKGGIPYGIALAAAGLVQYPHTLIWAKLFA